MDSFYKKDDKIGEIPATIIKPSQTNGYGLIFYHGWGSNRKNQIFRANIFASYGYTVLLPDGIFHGDRGQLDYEDKSVQRKKIPLVLIQNIKEFREIQKFFTEQTGIEADHIFTGGHSMGAMTASALLFNNEEIYGSIALNGMTDWSIFIDELENEEEEYRLLEDVKHFNPGSKIERAKNRPLCMLNGELDQEVPVRLQEDFYKYLHKIYTKPDKVYFEKFPLTNHVVTTNMMERAIKFMNKQRKSK